MNKKVMSKRGLSPVVATVLIIMITVVAATMIAVFLIPFINDKLGEGKGCFEVLGDISFHGTEYGCYSGTQGEVTGFSVNVNSDKIQGFTLLAVKGGKSNRYKIIDGANYPDLKMLGDGLFGGEEIYPIEFPGEGGIRTYVYNGAVDSFEIYPILKDGEQCEQSGQFEPNLCPRNDIVDCLVNGVC